MNGCNLEKGLRRYYRAIRRRLICPRALRRQTLENLQSNVAEYLEGHPGAAMADIEALFGTPESFANDVLCTLEPQEIRSYTRKWRLVRIVVLGAVAAGLIWFTAVCVIQAIYAYKEPPVVITIGPAVEDSRMPIDEPQT